MQMYPRGLIRLGFAAALLLGTGTLFGRELNLRGSQLLHIEMTWGVPDLQNGTLDLDFGFAGQGTVCHMPGLVLGFTQDFHLVLNLATGGGTGTATVTLRDAQGDLLVLSLLEKIDPEPKGGHNATWNGTYTVLLGTGRYAGASGGGRFSGWTDFILDPATLDPYGSPRFGVARWEFAGRLVLPDKH